MGAVEMVDVQALANDFPHLFPGVQTGHGVLENHLHLGPQALGGLFIQPAGNVLAVKYDLPRRRLIQADDAASDGGFSGAGLSHQAVGLAGVNVKAHPVHGPDGIAGIHFKLLF